MKTQFRRMLACLLSALLFVGMAAACGSDKKPASSRTTTTAGGESTTTASGGETEETNPFEETTEGDATGDSTASAAAKTNTPTESQTAKPPTQTNAPTTSGLPAINLGGATITIRTVWEEAFGAGNKEKSKIGDLWMAKRKEIETKYNCRIVNKVMNPNDTTVQIIAKVKSGDTKLGDVLVCQRLDLERSRLAKGVLTDLNTVANLNLKDSRWNKALITASTFGGKTYGAGFGMPDVQSGMLVNLDLLKKINPKFDIFQLVEQNKWTYDKFIEVCALATKDLNNDGKFDENDQYGATGINSPTMQALVMGNGLRILQPDGKGRMQYVLNNQTNIDTINYLRDNLVFKNYWKSFSSNDAAAKAFLGGRVLFLGTPAWAVLEYQEKSKINFGFVPAPLGTNGKEKNYINLGDGWAQVLCIPTTNKNPERIGAVLSEFLMLSGQIRSLTIDMYENEYFPNHAPSMVGIKKMLDNPLYDYFIPEVGDKAPWDAIMQGLWVEDTTFAKKLQEIDTSYKKSVDDYYNKNME